MKTPNKKLFNVNRANRLLLFTKNILEQHNIEYWLDSSTLLSIYQDKMLPSQTRYMTIGIYNNNLEKFISLRKSFLPWYKMKMKYDRSGFKWIEGDIAKVCLEPIIFSKKKKFGLEIIIKFVAGEYTRWVSGFSCKQVPSKYYNAVESLLYSNAYFSIPSRTEEYLRIRYCNWPEVIKGWDSNSHDGAIIDKKSMLNLSKKSRKSKRRLYRKDIRMEGKNLEVMKSLLTDTANILSKHRINYWLDCGTLLGIIRAKELIPWDHDADIAISSKDSEKAIKVLNMLPFKYRVSLRHDYSGWLPGTLRLIRIKLLKYKPLRLLRHREIHLDIYVKYKFEDYYYWIEMKTPKRIHADFYDNLDQVSWNGKKFAIPSKVEQYLTSRYGDWKESRESYDPSVDDLAIYEELQYKPKTEGLFGNKN